MIKRLLSWLKHKTGTVRGRAIMWRRADHVMMIGFACECGQTHGIRMAAEQFQPWRQGPVTCENCQHGWLAVRPVYTGILECPNCREFTVAKPR